MPEYIDKCSGQKDITKTVRTVLFGAPDMNALY